MSKAMFFQGMEVGRAVARVKFDISIPPEVRGSFLGKPAVSDCEDGSFAIVGLIDEVKAYGGLSNGARMACFHVSLTAEGVEAYRALDMGSPVQLECEQGTRVFVCLRFRNPKLARIIMP